MHQYLGALIESRADRAPKRGYAAHAARFLSEYADIKSGRAK